MLQRKPRAQGFGRPAAIDVFGPDGHIRKLRDIEEDVVVLAVSLSGGSVTRAAQRLKIARSTAYRKLEEAKRRSP
jgi:DNA-binding NtrC family response regulator